MDSTQFKRAAHEAVDKIADYFDNIHNLRVKSDVRPGFLRDLIPSAPPEEPEPWSLINQDLHQIIVPGMCHWSHPGFMTYFPASSTFEGILGELYSVAFTNPAFDWVCSPSVTELENLMVGWVAQLVALPDQFQALLGEPANGLLMGSTTETLITTMVAARHRYLQNVMMKPDKINPPLDEESLKQRLVVLGSSETHPSTGKAAAIIGVQYRSIHCDPTDGVALTGAKLSVLIDECLSEGLIPFYLTVTLGSTSTCAVDEFEAISQVLQDFPGVWVHVDAAFAGAALVCEEYQHFSASMARFDSFSMNLAKWFLVNFDACVLIVARNTQLSDSLKMSLPLLENEQSKSGTVIDYRDWQISMGRRFRSLKVWFVLRAHGKSGIQRHIRRHISMAHEFTAWLQMRPDLFEIVCKPQFALNVFRIAEGWTERIGMNVEQATMKLLISVNETGEFWIGKTEVCGRLAIRIIAANKKTDVEALGRLFCKIVEITQAFGTPDDGNRLEL